ncbi:MAG TPA: DNA polymerase IV [Acidimicrobiia bacterium]|nr:DNA polymerase IV [Acidimicrobiia bacterium]
MWTEPILHVDMDSFYVEVERLERPDLRGRAVAVGGTGPRGVIASASYEARVHGVRSAQPTATALRLCPGLKVVPPSHGRYAEVSERVFEVFRSFTPLVEGLSLDEAFLDVSGLRLHYESPVAVGEAVRTRLREDPGLPASVGVASVKFLAKLASEAAKPDGLRHVPLDEQLRFLHPLPASALWGVGPATQAALARLGVETVGDIAALPERTLVAAVGAAAGRQLHDLSHGRDERSVTPDGDAKSISVEETYDSDLIGRDVVESALLAHAQRLSGRLRRAGLDSRTISLKVRFPDFQTVTRSQTLAGGIDGSRELYKVALELAAGVDFSQPVRLLGLGAGSLQRSDRPSQLRIDSEQGWEKMDDAVAGIRERFGDQAVNPARLGARLKREGPGKKNPDA